MKSIKIQKTKLNRNDKNKENTKTAILASGKIAYCVGASIGLTPNILYTTNYVLVIGTQLYIVVKSFLLASWMNEVENEHLHLNLCSATNDRIITLGQVKLYIELSDLCTMTKLNEIESLSVSMLIGTDFMDKHVTSIYITKRKLKPLSSGRIAILSIGGQGQIAKSVALSHKEKEDHGSDYIRGSEMNNNVRLTVENRTEIQSHSVQKELFVSKGLWLIYFEQNKQLARREQLTFPKGIMEALPFGTFNVLIVNSATSEINTLKYMVIPQRSNILSIIVDIEVSYQQSLVDNNQKKYASIVPTNASQGTLEATQ